MSKELQKKIGKREKSEPIRFLLSCQGETCKPEQEHETPDVYVFCRFQHMMVVHQ